MNHWPEWLRRDCDRYACTWLACNDGNEAPVVIAPTLHSLESALSKLGYIDNKYRSRHFRWTCGGPEPKNECFQLDPAIQIYHVPADRDRREKILKYWRMQ